MRFRAREGGRAADGVIAAGGVLAAVVVAAAGRAEGSRAEVWGARPCLSEDLAAVKSEALAAVKSEDLVAALRRRTHQP